MTNEQVGKYIKLLCLEHQKGHLDEATMLCICNGDEAVMEKFKQDSDGRYFNERMELEKAKRSKSGDASRENGKLGGRPKKETYQEPNENLQVSEEKPNENLQVIFSKPKQNLSENENENENEVEIKDVEEDLKHYENTSFARFWDAYPIKKNRGQAEKAFQRIKGVPVETMIKAIEIQKRSESWQKNNGQYIPYPSTWLNGKRWLDEVPDVVKEPESVKNELPDSIVIRKKR